MPSSLTKLQRVWALNSSGITLQGVPAFVDFVASEKLPFMFHRGGHQASLPLNNPGMYCTLSQAGQAPLDSVLLVCSEMTIGGQRL